MPSDEESQQEIARIIACKNPIDPFSVLGVDLTSCDMSVLKARFKEIVLRTHPDKCKLPHAADAFTLAEKAYRKVPDEGILHRFKVAHERKLQRERELESSGKHSKASGTRPPATQPGAAETKEARVHRMREEDMRERQLEIARKAEEREQKKRRVESQAEEESKLAAQLAEQQRLWNEAKL